MTGISLIPTVLATGVVDAHFAGMTAGITDRLARLVYILIWLTIVGFIIVLARYVMLDGMPGRVHVDPRTGTAGLSVETDQGTGCQYIVTPWGGIMPRTAADGKQICQAK